MRSLLRVRPRTDVPTSSLADIAFLLLIFFLVTTVFDEEKGLPLMLPDGEVEVSAETVLHMLARADGVVEVRAGESPDALIVGPRDLARIWREAVAQRPGLIAAVHVEADASYVRMVDVLDELQSAGAKRISLQVAKR